jgi:hypothetical protein
MKTFIKLIIIYCCATAARAQVPTANFTYNAAGLRVQRTILNPVPLIGNKGTDPATASYKDSVGQASKPAVPANQLLQSGASEISLYPNPVASSLKITATDERLINAEVTVYELTGRTVLKQKLVQQSCSIDLSGLVTAAYLVEITDNTRTRYIYRIIKQ